MTREIFYALYRELSSAQSEPGKYVTILDEIAKLCRDRKISASSSEEWLAEADNCLHEIAESSTLFVAAISNWLTSIDDIELAKALLHKVDVRNLQNSSATIYDLSTLDEDCAILTGCRLCALNSAPAVSLGWALSIATSNLPSEKIHHAVDILLQYHADEFPRTTFRLLSSEDSQFKSLTLSEKISAELQQQEKWLEELPRLREFAMSPEMRLTLNSLRRNENRNIHRQAEETSIFSKIFTTQHFKYANKTAVEFVVGNQTQETTLAMSPFSLSIEIPVSEYTDPVLGADRRKDLWRGLPL